MTFYELGAWRRDKPVPASVRPHQTTKEWFYEVRRTAIWKMLAINEDDPDRPWQAFISDRGDSVFFQWGVKDGDDVLRE